MKPGSLITSILPIVLACAILAPATAFGQAITTVTIKNKTMVLLKYRSGSAGGGQESPQPARSLAPGASTTYRLSQYNAAKNAGSVTYEGDVGGFGCRFRFEAARLDDQRWSFDYSGAPSGKARAICDARLLSANPRDGSLVVEFSVR